MNRNNLHNDYDLVKIKEKIKELDNSDEYYITPFLSLSYQYEIENMLKEMKGFLDIYYFNSGERKVALIGNTQKKENLKPISLLEIVTSEQLKHNDIMGAILNIGLKREVIGNIYINNGYLVEVKNHVKEYVINNLNYISHYKVKVIESEKEIPVLDYVIKRVIVSSYRLDNVVSAIFNISRELSKELIINKEVQYNFNNELKIDQRISLESYLSCRRRGKVFIIGECGRTKKDNIILEVKYF